MIFIVLKKLNKFKYLLQKCIELNNGNINDIEK